MFFTVLWRGLCQALGWFFGLFGYKRDGKFAKCVWGLFATSAAIITTIMAIALVWCVGDSFYDYYKKHYRSCDDASCYENSYVSRNIYFHNHDDGKGYIYNINTGEKYLKHIAWIATPIGTDSLICFSNGKKRGYFSKNTGKEIIEAKYDHAWIFSNGLACVDDNGIIKFIDGTGKVVIDTKMAYYPNMEEFVFHGDYCVVNIDNTELYGLMDKTGKIVLPQEYDIITPNNEFGLWHAKKDNENIVFNKELKPILTMEDCSIYINEGTIDVTMSDHTMRKYDLEGNLINDFYIANFRTLEYEKDEILYRREMYDEDEENNLTSVESYQPKAIAHLRAYLAGDGYEGLMTPDGHRVTMPLYQDINAIGHDLYLCTSTNNDKVIVNGKGEIIR